MASQGNHNNNRHSTWGQDGGLDFRWVSGTSFNGSTGSNRSMGSSLGVSISPDHNPWIMGLADGRSLDGGVGLGFGWGGSISTNGNTFDRAAGGIGFGATGIRGALDIVGIFRIGSAFGSDTRGSNQTRPSTINNNIDMPIARHGFH